MVEGDCDNDDAASNGQQRKHRHRHRKDKTTGLRISDVDSEDSDLDDLSWNGDGEDFIWSKWTLTVMPHPAVTNASAAMAVAKI